MSVVKQVKNFMIDRTFFGYDYYIDSFSILKLYQNSLVRDLISSQEILVWKIPKNCRLVSNFKIETTSSIEILNYDKIEYPKR